MCFFMFRHLYMLVFQNETPVSIPVSFMFDEVGL